MLNWLNFPTYTFNFCPFALLLLIIALPPLVFILARKPHFLARLIVLFVIFFFMILSFFCELDYCNMLKICVVKMDYNIKVLDICQVA